MKNTSTWSTTRCLDAGADGATGSIDFKDQSKAGTADAVIDLNDHGGGNLSLRFWDAASADHATITAGVSSNIQFYNDSTAGNANITMRANSSLVFNGSYYGAPTNNAGNATIHLLGGSSIYSPGGSANFANYSTAANASITVEGAAAAGAGAGTLAFNNADAGTATIVLKSSPVPGSPGGALSFNGGGSAPLARITAEAGSLIYVVPNVSTSFGSLEGDGTISLGSSGITVGGLGLSTTYSGQILNYGRGNGGSLTKIGAGTFILSGISTYDGGTTVEAGTLAVNGSIQGDVLVKSGATLKGIGSIGGTVTCQGICAPGNSPGTITVAGLNLLGGSTLQFELGATGDHIVVTNSGTVTLSGMLDLVVLPGFNPALGDTFPLFEGSIGSITGAFSGVNAPIFNGHALNLIYGTNSVMLQVGMSGDFNGDGIANTADYVTWRKGLGTNYTQNDYNAWRAHFGQTAGSGAGTGAASLNVAVPEPAGLALMLIGLIGLVAGRAAAVRADA